MKELLDTGVEIKGSHMINLLLDSGLSTRLNHVTTIAPAPLVAKLRTQPQPLWLHYPGVQFSYFLRPCSFKVIITHPHPPSPSPLAACPTLALIRFDGPLQNEQYSKCTAFNPNCNSVRVSQLPVPEPCAWPIQYPAA